MTTTNKTPLTLAEIQRINTLAKRDLLNLNGIVAATGFDPVDVDLVIKGQYVADLADQWKDDADITLQEYETIHRRYQPGKGHWDTEYAIARDMLIRPATVLAIAHSRFQNAHTHPAPKPVKAKPEKSKAVRRLFSADLDEIHKLERFGWPAAEIAEKLGVPVEAIAHAQRCLRNRWSYPDILESVNSKYGKAA
ncbi:TPA: hypothetical protein NBJ46_002776 [Enterobacter hormaechei]|uniref:hypothetical protein n=1 Tax=Enterobacter cloacae complex TaxID=354276 RepID=UPI0007354824|nr:hypothetical protein [Enterobacter hormaechei]KYJ79405.1 hypothetical protein AT292_08220 [Enterobacter cloacae]KTG83040.1 hypothetical protein ASV36_07050 [Enterobacter hormaechei subsp. steigerwaltii]KVJ94841.1 hypothetical protein AWS22_04370 [Enterobacter hormaechei subsp. steigerwaltii]KVJ95488.1 hypothetical protein AWS21_07230 [Enterobacter hormaechei subsp. steigerwaltii]HCD2233258.1 hypothetical protein [Enterobacter hormaechei]